MKHILIILTFLFATVCTQAKAPITSHVHVTVYQPVAAQCQGNPLQTADGSIINLTKLKQGKIKWCAISRDLLYLFPMGTYIEVEGFGIYQIRDTMNKRHKHRIDLLIHPKDKTRLSKGNIKIKTVIDR